jgi:natural resistance-associated macrophage protein 2
MEEENDGVMILAERETEREAERDGILVSRRAALATDDGGVVATTTPWTPSSTGPGSGRWSWRDFMFFVGPGWFVSIAYIDPGNYQADIQAGATSRYSLLFVLWWTSILSMYVQMLCVRLAYHANMTLAECQARHLPNRTLRYLHWAIAEFSTVITDLPEVIGIGIAGHIFFGWPYYVGVILSLLTTMAFLATMNFGVHVLETIVFLFVGIMSVALFVEMDFVKPDAGALVRGWLYGFQHVGYGDIFAITGVVGAVVMPHNLYLHTAACQARPVHPHYVKQAVRYSSLEPILPIAVSFGVNLAIVAIAAEQVYGADGADQVGLTDFCDYFRKLKGGCVLWGIALLAAGQSSAITTTYTGQYVMDGFLDLRLPVQWRAVITRLVAITPCVLVSVLLPNQMNRMVNIVNSSLSFLLPFAFTPLVKYNCSVEFMGERNVSRGVEKMVLYGFAVAVWLVNAVALSVNGGGFFGDLRAAAATADAGSATKLGPVFMTIVEIALQVFYAGWNWYILRAPVPAGVTTHDRRLINTANDDGNGDNIEEGEDQPEDGNDNMPADANGSARPVPQTYAPLTATQDDGEFELL